MPQLLQNENEQTVANFGAGMTHGDIANHFHRPRSGRPHVTSKRQNRPIRLLHFPDRFVGGSLVVGGGICRNGCRQ